jgi:hypothetical protein
VLQGSKGFREMVFFTASAKRMCGDNVCSVGEMPCGIPSDVDHPSLQLGSGPGSHEQLSKLPLAPKMGSFPMPFGYFGFPYICMVPSVSSEKHASEISKDGFPGADDIFEHDIWRGHYYYDHQEEYDPDDSSDKKRADSPQSTDDAAYPEEAQKGASKAPVMASKEAANRSDDSNVRVLKTEISDEYKEQEAMEACLYILIVLRCRCASLCCGCS